MRADRRTRYRSRDSEASRARLTSSDRGPHRGAARHVSSSLRHATLPGARVSQRIRVPAAVRAAVAEGHRRHFANQLPESAGLQHPQLPLLLQRRRRCGRRRRRRWAAGSLLHLQPRPEQALSEQGQLPVRGHHRQGGRRRPGWVEDRRHHGRRQRRRARRHLRVGRRATSRCTGATCCTSTTATAPSPIARRSTGSSTPATPRRPSSSITTAMATSTCTCSTTRTHTERAHRVTGVARGASVRSNGRPAVQKRRRPLHGRDARPRALRDGVDGYGLGVVASDLNVDGCPDLYVANDFQENDYLYINNCNGTFTESIAKATGHTSRFSMGVDAADFNNDGRPDMVVAGHAPRARGDPQDAPRPPRASTSTT